MEISDAGKECLRFSLIPGLGLKKFHLLLNVFGTLESLSRASASELQQLGFDSKLTTYLAESNEGKDRFRIPDHVIDWLSDTANHLICLEDNDYPPMLRQTHLAPPLLYVTGSLSALNTTQLAIVGSRKPSPAGADIAKEFSFACASNGLSICSGLALGVDGCAHMGSLAAKGKTIAVMATGLDRYYPQRHETLAREIVAQEGALVSEMPLGTAPLRHNFPRRNRIVSGLSLGVLVVEAGLKSGSLITARYALEQNREVFAVPGGVRNPLSEGCNWLIKEGAYLVSKPEDILHSLSGFRAIQGSVSQPLEGGPAPSLHSSESLGKDEASILDALGDTVRTEDELYVMTSLNLDQLSLLLLDLELKGLVAPTAGGYQRMS